MKPTRNESPGKGINYSVPTTKCRVNSEGGRKKITLDFHPPFPHYSVPFVDRNLGVFRLLSQDGIAFVLKRQLKPNDTPTKLKETSTKSVLAELFRFGVVGIHWVKCKISEAKILRARILVQTEMTG